MVQHHVRGAAAVTDVRLDDISIRKGQTYAVGVYDKKDGAMLALPAVRDGVELRKWLKDHPRIKHGAWDRAGAYAKATSENLPECVRLAAAIIYLQLSQIKLSALCLSMAEVIMATMAGKLVHT